jgi:PilZ domain
MTPDPAGPRRLPADAVSGITGLRLHPPGAEAALVNISSTGLLAESLTRLRVAAVVEVHVHGGFTPPVITGRVVRCEVAVMERDGLLRYHIAIEFESPIALAEEQKALESPPVPARTVKNRW